MNNIRIYLGKDTFQPPVKLVQFDKGFTLTFEVYNSDGTPHIFTNDEHIEFDVKINDNILLASSKDEFSINGNLAMWTLKRELTVNSGKGIFTFSVCNSKTNSKISCFLREIIIGNAALNEDSISTEVLITALEELKEENSEAIKNINNLEQAIANGNLDNYLTKEEASMTYAPIGSGGGGNGLSIFTVSEIKATPSKALLNSIFLINGFYNEKDMSLTYFKCIALNGNENFKDIGNGILVGDDCSVKIDNIKKIVPIVKDSLSISQMGAISGNSEIDNSIIINSILKLVRTCNLDAGLYYIKNSIIHQENSEIIGKGIDATVIKLANGTNKYPFKSQVSDLTQFTMLSNTIKFKDFTLDGNYKYNNTRNYTQNVYNSYWGFGFMLCNINNLYIENIRIKDTEAWGISYWLCNNVNVKNLYLDQDETVFDNNQDGITGSAKTVHIDGVRGYTGDDMVAVTTGTASLRSHDCGVTCNIDIDNITIKNVFGKTKNNVLAYSGVGIYMDKGKTISNVLIDNIRGDFYVDPISIADYWTTDNIVNTKIKNCIISNVTGSHTLRSAIYISSTQIEDLVMENIIETGMTNDNLAVVELTETTITSLIIKDVSAIRLNSCNTMNIIKNNNSVITHLKLDGVIVRDGGTYATNIYLVNGGTVGNMSLREINFGKPYNKQMFNCGSGINLNCDKIMLPSSLAVTSAAVTASNTTLYILGNSLVIMSDIKVNVTNVGLNHDIFDLSALPFNLATSYDCSVNMGGQPVTESKPIGAFLYDSTSKKVVMQMPSLNGAPTVGELRYFAQIRIPLL